MAQRLLYAMDSIDTEAKAILNKYEKKRALGDIQARYQYQPTQPVLSCQTVDVDLSGTRTFRARSAEDIIQEQHLLIHNIYKKARETHSAPATRSSCQRPSSRYSQQRQVDEVQRISRAASSLAVSGTTGISSRPLSCPPGGAKLLHKKRAGLQRPKTSDPRKTAKPATETFLRLQVDPDLLASSLSLNNVKEQVQDQWSPSNRELVGGTFARSPREENSAHVEPDSHWLSFGGGGRTDRRAGVVQAFTGMANPDDVYNIEGSIGTKVATSLHRGDKIRIGINGRMQSDSLKIKKWDKGEMPAKMYKFERLDVRERNDFLNTALSWDDQLSRPGTKILAPRAQGGEKTKPNLCESHPVVFEKLIKDEPGHRDQRFPISRKYKKEELNKKHRVKHKTKLSETFGKKDLKKNGITNVVINKLTEEDDEAVDRLIYEDILKDKCPKSSADVRKKKNTTKSIARVTKFRKDSQSSESDVSRKGSVGSDQSASSPMVNQRQIVRPPSSMSSIGYDGPGISVEPQEWDKTRPQKAPIGWDKNSSQRASSAKVRTGRPVSSRMSNSSRGVAGSPLAPHDYIQISQPITAKENSRCETPNQSQADIDASGVCDINQHQYNRSTPDLGRLSRGSGSGQKSRSGFSAPAPTLSHSISPAPTRLSFEIPVADDLALSDVNSLSNFSDRDLDFDDVLSEVDGTETEGKFADDDLCINNNSSHTGLNHLGINNNSSQIDLNHLGINDNSSQIDLNHNKIALNGDGIDFDADLVEVHDQQIEHVADMLVGAVIGGNEDPGYRRSHHDLKELHVDNRCASQLESIIEEDHQGEDER